MKRTKIKILIASIIVFSLCNGCFANTETVEQKEETSTVYSAYVKKSNELKDPNLITLPTAPKVDEKKYKEKLKADNQTYAKNKKGLTKEQYQLYKIFDKLIRANNLQYQNWRIAFNNKATDDVNAVATAANLVIVNSALYDSMFNDNDCLASIMGHELAHLLLGHLQKTLDYYIKIKEYNALIKRYQQAADRQERLNHYNIMYSNSMDFAIKSAGASAGYAGSIAFFQEKVAALYRRLQALETEADKEGLNLLIKAGFDGQKSIKEYDFLDLLPEADTSFKEHPSTEKRKQDVIDELAITDTELLIDQGKYNLYNSTPLNVIKSSDKKSIILLSQEGHERFEYQPYTTAQKYKEKGYIECKNKNFKEAIANFEKSYEQKRNDYVVPLYLSYSYEQTFLTSKDKNDFKMSARWLKIARKLNKEDANIIQQRADLKQLRRQIKKEKSKAAPPSETEQT